MVARVLTNGLKEVVPFLVAMWIGEAVWLTLAVAGMAAIAATLGHLFILLRYAGAAYLVYLALRMWNARSASTIAGRPLRSCRGRCSAPAWR